MKIEDGIPPSLEDAFELSASAKPIKHLGRKKPENIRREMSQKMNHEIHAIFQTLATGIPVLGLYTINYDNSEESLDNGKAILRFSILPENRLLSHQIADARSHMEGFLTVLVKCCPDKDALKIDARPSTFTYDLEYKHNSLIDALYNFVQDVMEPNQEVLSHLYLAGHILGRIEDYKPANKLN